MKKGAEQIALTGKGQGKSALVDRADFLRVSKYKWHVSTDGYPSANIGDKTRKNRCRYISLHRFILEEPKSEIDHINRNKLDNRRKNLRLVTRSVNCFNRGMHKNNTSGVRGVHRHKDGWRAQLQYNGVVYRSKKFNSRTEASKARLILEKQYAK